MKLFLAAYCAATASLSQAASSSPTCQAVVIGGLGSQQAYVAGALKTLITSGGASYDVVVSTGASVLAAQAAASGSDNFAQDAQKTVQGLSAADMYTQWPGGVADGVEHQTGLFNATNSQAVYQHILSNPSGTNDRTVVAIAVSLTSTLQVPLPVSTTPSDIATSVAGLTASAADPTTFQAVAASFEGSPDLYVSGETRGQVDVFEAVSQCRKLGAKDEDITVDVVYTSSSYLLQRDVSKDNTLLVTLRTDSIRKYLGATKDVVYAKWAYPDVNFRYDVSPSFNLFQKTTDYNKLGMATMSTRGALDASKEIKRVHAGVECDPATQAPTSCDEDQDCFTWAAKSCFDPDISKRGRCLGATPDAHGSCSFNATEIAETRAKRVTMGDDAGTCYSIGFSGGGDRAAYEAGAFKGLVDNMAPAEVLYQAASGVSAGSLVSAGLSSVPIGLEKTAANQLVAIAATPSRGELFKNWTNLIPFVGPCCEQRGLFFESGLYDSSPMRSFLEQAFPNTPPPTGPGVAYRTHTAFATNMGTGQGKTFQFVGSQGTPLMIDALMASSAYQSVLPMVQIGSETYGDGGLLASLDIYNAVDNCRDLGYSDANIVVDTIAVAGYSQTVLPPGAVFFMTTAEIAQRVQIMQAIDEIMSVVSFYREADPGLFRKEIYPSVEFPAGLGFNATLMQIMVQTGIADGKAAALESNDVDALPASCTYQSAKVACGSNRDCFNWGVEKCKDSLTSALCDHDSRQCMFTL